jgi:hypothetical protein
MLLRLDWVHAHFLGVGQIVNGNILWELVVLGHFAPTHLGHSMSLNSAFASFKAFLRGRRLHCSQRGFTLGSLKHPQRGGQPEMALKAHDSRLVTAWLARECKHAADIDREAGRLRELVARHQEELCLCLEALPRHVGPSEAVGLSSCYQLFWGSLNLMSSRAIASGLSAWNNVPKQHFQYHQLDDCCEDSLNPKYFQGYTDEDFMQWVVRTAWGAAKGRLEFMTLNLWLLQQRGVWDDLVPCT